MDNGTDYRRRTLEHVKLYHTPLGPEADAEMSQAFDQLAEVHDEDPVLHIEQREIRARRKAGGVVWFDFKALCGGPRSQNDYLEIATQFHTVLLSDVPYMPVSMASRPDDVMISNGTPSCSDSAACRSGSMPVISPLSSIVR